MAILQQNICGWIEIPVKDMDRASAFYERVLGIKFTYFMLGEMKMAWFPSNPAAHGAAGALVQAPEHYKPSHNGVVIYLSSPALDLSVELSRVEKAGGKIAMDKTAISPEHGFMGFFIDTEGNRIGLHSQK